MGKLFYPAHMTSNKLLHWSHSKQSRIKLPVLLAGITLHVSLLGGRDAHHIAEAQFKAFARALRAAVEADPRVQGVPSTKGSL